MTTKPLSLATLAPHAAIIDAEQMSGLDALLDGLQNNLQAVRDSGRDLRIAVVGQMKAGKSSFLNAAFFGRDLLPKAETPMTAALTRIVYAPRARAEVVFYSADDWDGIEQRASQYPAAYEQAQRSLLETVKPASPFARPVTPRQPSHEEILRKVPQAIRASLELVEKARQQGLDVRRYLGRTETLEHVEGARHLAGALHEYVGSGGRYTAITKMSVLYVDDPRLQGLEIIDTPGFNDPVVSRGQITRNFLGQCDVIFLLSAASQFLTAADMSVLREQLPEAGIDDKAVFLVASQRDLALRQDRGIAIKASKLTEREPLEQRQAARASAMIQLLDMKVADMARQTLDNQISQPGLDEKSCRVLGAVQQSAPRSISAWAWLTAEDLASLDEDSRDQLDRLCRATGYAFDQQSLQQLSNIPSVRDEVLAQRERKQQLLAGKERALLEGVHNGMRERLQRIDQSLQEHAERIRSGDIEALQRTEQDMLQRLQGGKVRLETVFDEQAVRASQQFALLRTEVRDLSRRYSKTTTHKETTTESYSVSTSKWYNPFSWGSEETRYRDVVTVYASAQDAIEKVQDFALQSTRSLQQAIIDCIDLDQLRRQVGMAAMSLFDAGSASFDADLMLAEVNKSLRRITIPDIDFGNRDYSQRIARAFGNERVSEEHMDGLRQAQREAVAAIIVDLEGEAERKVKAIETSLQRTGERFVADMSRDIQQGLTGLRDDIANQQQRILQIAAARQAVAQVLADL